MFKLDTPQVKEILSNTGLRIPLPQAVIDKYAAFMEGETLEDYLTGYNVSEDDIDHTIRELLQGKALIGGCPELRVYSREDTLYIESDEEEIDCISIEELKGILLLYAGDNSDFEGKISQSLLTKEQFLKRITKEDEE